jgi:hypothetical protein
MAMMVPVVMLMMPTIMIPMSMAALDTMHYATGDALAWIPLPQGRCASRQHDSGGGGKKDDLLVHRDLLLTIELFLRKQALPCVGRITIKERISKHHSGLGGAHRSDDPDRIARAPQFLISSLRHARSSGGGIPKIADAIMICLYALELPLDNCSHVRRQILLECRLIGVLSGVFATLAFGEHRVFVHAGNGGLYVGPSAMHRPAYRSALRWLPTKTTNFSFQFRSALGTASGSCFE